MKLKSILLICLIVSLTSACSKKFFERYPSNQITVNNHYRNPEDFNQAVGSCYVKLKSEMGWHLQELAYRTDECQLESMTVQDRDRYNIDHFSENSSTSLLSTVWNTWYNGIYRCNDVLNHLEMTDFEMAGKYRGELLFIRSWHYFNLYRTFGVVPVTTKVVTPEESKFIPRCTEEEMYTRLSSDLAEAARLLPENRSAEVARVTKIAAYTLLGKVNLTFGKYAEAKEVLDSAFKCPGYGMMKTTAEAFDVKNKMNKEIIFALYYNKSTDNGHGYWYNASTSVKKDIKNPKAEFKAIYQAEDNRLELIDSYREITPNKVYAMKKWDDVYDATYTTKVGNDFPHLRYADLHLLYAEACFRTNNMDKANEHLNVTRTRAGLENKEFSGEDFIRELADERGREFALEGQRWYDLVRLGLAKEKLESKGMKAHNVLFPIPLDQIKIVNNGSVLWQNPGF